MYSALLGLARSVGYLGYCTVRCFRVYFFDILDQIEIVQLGMQGWIFRLYLYIFGLVQ